MAYKTPVAWEVSCEDEDGNATVVVYSRHGIVARREGAQELGVDPEEVETRRAKHWDAMFPKGPTREDEFNHGWAMPCDICNEGFHARKNDGGKYDGGLFWCETCAGYRMEMIDIRTPRWAGACFGPWYVYGKYTDPDGRERYGHVVKHLGIHDLPVKAERGKDPYFWFNPFRP